MQGSGGTGGPGLSHAGAFLCAVAARFCATAHHVVRIRVPCATLLAFTADLRAFGTEMRMMRGAADHEIGGDGTDPGAIHHDADVRGLRMATTFLQAMRDGRETCPVAVETCLDAVVHFLVHMRLPRLVRGERRGLHAVAARIATKFCNGYRRTDRRRCSCEGSPRGSDGHRRKELDLPMMGRATQSAAGALEAPGMERRPVAKRLSGHRPRPGRAASRAGGMPGVRGWTGLICTTAQSGNHDQHLTRKAPGRGGGSGDG